MVTRGPVAFAVAALLLVACYSGLTSLAPFPCAADGTCPSGLFCNADPTNPECVTSCPDGFTGCSGVCVDTSSSTANCGACGQTCMTNATCSQGACTCGTLTNCSDTCVDVTTDTNNCGKCGVSCGGSCEGGLCRNACTLFDDTSCSSGTVCGLSGLSDTLWGTACQVSGSSTAGQPCTHGNACAPGLQCLEVNNIAWCWTLCDATHPCSGGATCNTNANISNKGGYCQTSSACGASNSTLPCNGGFCPQNSTCTPGNQFPCTCAAGFAAFNCQNVSCSGTTCDYPNWWCD